MSRSIIRLFYLVLLACVLWPGRVSGQVVLKPNGQAAMPLRVKAVLPWGEMVELGPSSQPHRFFALVPRSANRGEAGSDVTFIVTDRAHNRTTLTVELAAAR